MSEPMTNWKGVRWVDSIKMRNMAEEIGLHFAHDCNDSMCGEDADASNCEVAWIEDKLSDFLDEQAVDKQSTSQPKQRELKPLNITDDRPDYEWNGEFTQESLDKGVKAALAARPQEQDCAKPYAEIEGEWQASQPPAGNLKGRLPTAEQIGAEPFEEGIGKPEDYCDHGLSKASNECELCASQPPEAQPCENNPGLTDFQRGQLAMAEKAAQHRLVKYPSDALSRCVCGAKPDTCNIAAWWEEHMRSLAGAVEPPQEKEQP